MSDEIRCRETKDGVRFYAFHCPACGARGTLGLHVGESGTFPCPGECGARFIEYDHLGDWRIRCVVQPVFEAIEA